MVQWIKICLPRQGIGVWSLVQEDSSGCRVTKPETAEPVCPGACALQEKTLKMSRPYTTAESSLRFPKSGKAPSAATKTRHSQKPTKQTFAHTKACIGILSLSFFLTGILLTALFVIAKYWEQPSVLPQVTGWTNPGTSINGKLFSKGKECISDTCNNLDGPQEHIFY